MTDIDTSPPSIVQAIVDAHGGTVDAAKDPGGGTRFTVRLPRSSPRRLHRPDSEAGDLSVDRRDAEEKMSTPASPALPALVWSTLIDGSIGQVRGQDTIDPLPQPGR